VRLVHELEQFVDHRFQEFPVRLEEAWVLSDDIHDIRGYDGLVILAALHLAKSK
jgi:hypothetical protein